MQPSADVPEGDVARQDPENGTRIEKGKTVSYWISSGEGKVAVPDVVGMSQVNAAATLAKAGLDVATKEEVNPDEAVGTVLRQNPEADKEVDAGTTVTITVAAANNTVKVPGSRRGHHDAGHGGRPAQQHGPGGQDPGGRLRPFPAAPWSTRTPRAARRSNRARPVTIYVSNAPVVNTVKVPAVAALGLTEAQAKARLAQYGLKAKVVDLGDARLQAGPVHLSGSRRRESR